MDYKGVDFLIYKVINSDKIKILIEKNEIKNIENICFDNANEDTKNAIAILLIGIYEQTGLNFLNSSILIESVKGYSDTFYVMITRLETKTNKSSESDEVDMYLFKLNGIEEIFDFTSFFVKNHSILKSSRLYKYKNGLYVCLYLVQEKNNENDTTNLILSIEKKYLRCRWSILNDVILNEWGALICDNIIENIIAAD